MLRKLFMVAALSGATLVGGCATSGTGTGGLPSAGDISAQVKEFTIGLCAFDPLVNNALVQSLIAQYYPAGVPIDQAVQAIGQAICGGQTAATGGRSRLGGTGTAYKIVKTPKGVVRVPGKFVRRG